MRDIWKDALVGSVGFGAAFAAFVFLGPLRSLVNADERLPLKAGFIAAVALAISREISQSLSKRATSPHA